MLHLCVSMYIFVLPENWKHSMAERHGPCWHTMGISMGVVMCHHRSLDPWWLGVPFLFSETISLITQASFFSKLFKSLLEGLNWAAFPPFCPRSSRDSPNIWEERLATSSPHPLDILWERGLWVAAQQDMFAAVTAFHLSPTLGLKCLLPLSLYLMLRLTFPKPQYLVGLFDLSPNLPWCIYIRYTLVHPPGDSTWVLKSVCE